LIPSNLTTTGKKETYKMKWKIRKTTKMNKKGKAKMRGREKSHTIEKITRFQHSFFPLLKPKEDEIAEETKQKIEEENN